MTDETAKTPKPPYYAVIFSSKRTQEDEEGYQEMAARIGALAARQPGYLGVESVRDDHLGITVSYWRDEESVASWKRNLEHAQAIHFGKEKWYAYFSLRVAKVERDYEFDKE